MSNPTMAPTVELRELMDAGKIAPRYFFANYVPGDWDQTMKSAPQVDTLQRALRLTRSVRFASVVRPGHLAADTVDMAKAAAGKQLLLTAPKGKPLWAVRSGHIMPVVDKLWGMLDPVAKKLVGTAMLRRGHCSAGAEYSVGRIRNSAKRPNAVIPRPPTKVEVEAAISAMGYEDHPLLRSADWSFTPYALWEGRTPTAAADPSGAVPAVPQYVRVNPDANCGCPVGSNLGNPDALEKVKKCVVDLEDRLRGATTRDAVYAVYTATLRDAPWLLTQLGATKNEVVDVDKVLNKEMRHYVIVPAQVKLLIQSVTQPAKANVINMLETHYTEGNHNFVGASFAHGGAHKLLHHLAEACVTYGYAYAINGDDCLMLVCLSDGSVISLSLDFQRMDIATAAEVKVPVDQAWAERFAKYDPTMAWLWYSVMKTRAEIVATTVGYLTDDGNPSGVPWVSDTNGTVTCVNCERTHTALRALPEDGCTDADVRRVVAEVGALLGFVVTVDELYRDVGDESTGNCGYSHTVLANNAVTFCGYTLQYTHVGVQLTGDAVRFMTTLPYPRKPISDRGHFRASEAVRFAGKVLNLGNGTWPFSEEHMEMLYVEAIGLLATSLELTPELPESARLQLSMEQTEKGVELMASRPHMIRQLEKGWYELWPDGVQHLPWEYRDAWPSLYQRVRKLLDPALPPTLSLAEVDAQYDEIVGGPPSADERPSYLDVLEKLSPGDPLALESAEEAREQHNAAVLDLLAQRTKPGNAQARLKARGAVPGSAEAEEARAEELLAAPPGSATAAPAGPPPAVPERNPFDMFGLGMRPASGTNVPPRAAKNSVSEDNQGRPPPTAVAKAPRPRHPSRQGRGQAGMHQRPERRGGRLMAGSLHQEWEDDMYAMQVALWEAANPDADDDGDDRDDGSDFGREAEEVDHDTVLEHAFAGGVVGGSTG